MQLTLKICNFRGAAKIPVGVSQWKGGAHPQKIRICLAGLIWFAGVIVIAGQDIINDPGFSDVRILS